MAKRLTDKELRSRLEACGFDPGPLTEFTRSYWLRKLTEAEKKKKSLPRPVSQRRHPVRAGLLFPDEEDERHSYGRQNGDATSAGDGSDSSDDDALTSAEQRREMEAEQRKTAVSKVKVAGARLLEDVKKVHVQSRQPPFIVRHGLHLVVGVVLGIAALLFLDAVNWDMSRPPVSNRDDLIWCVPGQYCSEGSTDKVGKALSLAYRLAHEADRTAGHADCSERDVKRSVTYTTMREIAENMTSDSISAKLTLIDALKLFTRNLHWKISPINSQYILVDSGDVTLQSLSDLQVASTNPMKPLHCRLTKAVHSAATRALLFAVLSFVLVLGFIGVRYYLQKRDKEHKQVFHMVDKILSYLHHAHQCSVSGDADSSAVPVSHVRDSLLKPAERFSHSHIWDKAAAWVNQRESRVRRETRRISGEDFVVWRWIPISSYAEARSGDGGGAEETDGGSAANSPSTSFHQKSAAEKLDDREKQWGGHVLEHYSGDSFRKQVLPLAERPSCCIKLRNLYAVQPRPSGSEFEELEAGVLHKLTQHAGVLHCFLDRWTDEGALYAKLNSSDAATSVIAALHGTWYNSRLVKAEYVSLTEYHRLFPSSKTASKLMFPP